MDSYVILDLDHLYLSLHILCKQARKEVWLIPSPIELYNEVSEKFGLSPLITSLLLKRRI